MQYESIENKLAAMEREIAELKAAKATPRKKQSRVARIAIAAAMFLIPVVAFGVTITKPYTFVSGQPISASELNENFDTVYDRVNELGVVRIKAGTTTLGILLSASSANQGSFLSDEGYVSRIYKLNSSDDPTIGTTGTVAYHINSDCSDTPIVGYQYKKTVVNVLKSSGLSLVYGTGTQPASVPGYLRYPYSGSSCITNSQAGSQVVGDFTNSAANNETVTGVPNTVSGDISIVLE